MKEIIVEKMVNGINIGFIAWHKKCGVEYVVAWNMPCDDYVEHDNGIREFIGSWGQGHYFSNFDNAVECYNSYV